MTSNNASSAKVEVTMSASFKIDHLEEGKHTFLIPFGDDVARMVGQIVAYWGAFELRMDATIEHVAAASGQTLKQDWKRTGFKTRKELFRVVMRTYTAEMFPLLTREFESIVASATELHWQRNVIAHGYYKALPAETPLPSGVYPIRYVATSLLGKDPKSISLDEETLSKLWHDIAHLCGKLLWLISEMGGKSTAQEIVIHDSSIIENGASGKLKMVQISE